MARTPNHLIIPPSRWSPEELQNFLDLSRKGTFTAVRLKSFLGTLGIRSESMKKDDLTASVAKAIHALLQDKQTEATPSTALRYNHFLGDPAECVVPLIMPPRFDVKTKLNVRTDRVKCVDLHPTEPWIVASLFTGHVIIWNYETSQIAKTSELIEKPVRCVKFIPRKQWFVCGADDFNIRVYNYNTMEKVAQFEAHPDFIRSLAVHPSQPYILSCGDDTNIKMWDWEHDWRLVQTFEGHSHYVMQVVFNPQNPDTFASASLDHSVRIWSLTSSPAAILTLDGHGHGVNCVDFFPGSEKSYLISGGDDKLVKIWDYQTGTCVQSLAGHTNNITACAFHPHLPLLLSGSEDGSIRLWNINRNYKLEVNLDYNYNRVWTIVCLRGSNKIAVGFDAGLACLVCEQPQTTADENAQHPVLLALEDRLPDAILNPDAFRLTHSVLGEGVTGMIISAEYNDVECAAKPVRVSRIPKEDREVDTMIAEFSKLHALKHAFIVEFIGLCIPPVKRASDQTIWMLTKRAEHNLRECLNDGVCATWSMKRRLLFLRDLISGIEYMHKEGVAHLDLKPENILVDTEGRPLITDFGLSRFAPSGETVMSVLVGAGTPLYMPREQAIDGERVTVAADLFAFGLIAVEVLNGVHPLLTKFGRDLSRAHEFVKSGAVIECGLSPVQKNQLELQDETLFDVEKEWQHLSELFSQCVSAQADRRPTAHTLYRQFDLLTEFTRVDAGEQRDAKLAYFREMCHQLTSTVTELRAELAVLRRSTSSSDVQPSTVSIPVSSPLPDLVPAYQT